MMLAMGCEVRPGGDSNGTTTLCRERGSGARESAADSDGITTAGLKARRGGYGMGVKSQAPDKAPASGGLSFNQLLGIKRAFQETMKART
ncbi:hypothetical protein M0R45_016387 [Rubus argutus]|uniref:Brain-derived neurotrophic factor n=1 Tax=Rubus argutus TaxID=59490 RepID=A0AAW1XSM5_RUBAR